MESAKVLIVEDEAIIAHDIANNLKRLGYEPIGPVDSGEAAILKVENEHPDLVLMDIIINGDMDGIETAKQIIARFNVPVVYLSAHSDQATIGRAKETKVAGYLVKPFNTRDLSVTIEMVLRKHELEQQLAESEERFHKIFDCSTDAIFLIDAEDDRILEANASACKILKYSREDLVLKKFTGLFPDGHEPLKGFIASVFEKGQGRTDQLNSEKQSGQTFPVEISASMANLFGKPCLIAFVRDITERKRAETEERFRLSSSVIKGAMQAIMVVDLDDTIRSVNTAFTAVTGYTADEVIGKKPTILKSGWQDASYYEEMWRCIQEEGTWQGEIWNKRKNGEIYPEDLSINAIKDQSGEVTHYIAIFNELSEEGDEHQMNNYYDATTDLPNRFLLSDRLKVALRHAAYREESLAVLFFDLDQFREINKRFGREKGDQLLRTVARRLSGTVRDCDTLARFGDDKFVVVLSNPKDRNDIQAVLDKIMFTFSERIDLGEDKIKIGLTAGVSRYPEDGDNSETLIHLADDAMFSAKDDEGKTYKFSDECAQNQDLDLL